MDEWTKSPWDDTGIRDTTQRVAASEQEVWRQAEEDPWRKPSIADERPNKTPDPNNAALHSHSRIGDENELPGEGDVSPDHSLKSESHSEDEFGDFDEAHSPTFSVFPIDPQSFLDEFFPPSEQWTSGPADPFPTHASLQIFGRLVSVSRGVDGRVRRMRFQDSMIYSDSKMIVQKWGRNPIVSAKGRKAQTAAAMFGWDRVWSETQTNPEEHDKMPSASFSWSGPSGDLEQQTMQSLDLSAIDEYNKKKRETTRTADLQEVIPKPNDEIAVSQELDPKHVSSNKITPVSIFQDNLASPIPEILQPANETQLQHHSEDDDFGDFISSPQFSNISPQPNTSQLPESLPPKASWCDNILTPVSVSPSLSHSRDTSVRAVELPKEILKGKALGLGLDSTGTMPATGDIIDLLDTSIEAGGISNQPHILHKPAVQGAVIGAEDSASSVKISPSWDFSIFEDTQIPSASPIQSPKATDPVASIIASIPDLSYMLF